MCGIQTFTLKSVQAYGFCTKALTARGFSTAGTAEVSLENEDSSSPMVEHPPRIKFKRPDKTARHIRIYECKPRVIPGVVEHPVMLQ
jgi:hypothetical protein